MTREELNNELRMQCLNIPDLALPQFDAIEQSLKSLPEDKLAGVDQIIVTGCGDSYIAAEVSEEVFWKYLRGTGVRMFYLKAIEAARFARYEGERTLVIAISASGGPRRIREILERGNDHGCLTMAVTNNTESPAAKAAQLVLYVNTPPYEARIPGLRSYFASLLALDLLAVRIGQLRGSVPEGEMKRIRSELEAYSDRFRQAMDVIDEKAFETAEKWQEKKAFEVIADGPLYGSAEFIVAKFAEVSGDKATYVDSEDYCHVSTYFYPREAIGTIYVADSTAPAASRVKETVFQAAGDGRDILFVSDSGKEGFGIEEDIDVLTIPAPYQEFRFLYSLFSYIPGSILAGYRAGLIGEKFFRADRPLYREVDTISTSQIKII